MLDRYLLSKKETPLNVLTWNNFSLFFFQFVYVNGAFSPNPDESVIDLYNVSLCWLLVYLQLILLAAYLSYN